MAHRMLEEGCPLSQDLRRLREDRAQGADFLKINPMGKLPTIVHRRTVVTETAAIVAYVADA